MAELALIVEHLQNMATQRPMVSRILPPLVFNILAVGVAMRRGADGAAALQAGEAIAPIESPTEPPAATARHGAPVWASARRARWPG